MSGFSLWTSCNKVVDTHFHRPGEIEFVDHDDLRSQEHVRMLADHPRPLRHADHHHAGLRTQRKFCRADQVADVLDENQFQSGILDRSAIEPPLPTRFASRWQPFTVAICTTGNTHFRDGIVVRARGCIAIEDRHAEAVFQFLNQARDQRGLAGADRPHHVDGLDAVFVQQCAIVARDFCVGLEQAVLQFDVVDFLRIASIVSIILLVVDMFAFCFVYSFCEAHQGRWACGVV